MLVLSTVFQGTFLGSNGIVMGVTATIFLISHQANTIRNRLRLRLGVMPGTKLALWPSGLLEVGDFRVVNLRYPEVICLVVKIHFTFHPCVFQMTLNSHQFSKVGPAKDSKVDAIVFLICQVLNMEDI